MALVDNAWYISSASYTSVTQWAALTTYDAGALRRQLASPASGSERVFTVVVGHVASGASEPTWTTTRGGKTTDATITWQEATGIAALNGDFSNTPKWSNASIKNNAITLGQVITDVAGTIVLICTTAGTAGNGAEPTWAAYTTAGATTADNTVTWTNLGVVGNFNGWKSPHATITNAVAATWGQAGNSFFIGDDHNESTAAAITIAYPGTVTSRNNAYVVDHTVTSPGSANLKTGAAGAGSVATTGASGITVTGSVYIYGLYYSCGSGNNAATLSHGNANNIAILENCTLLLNSTNTGSRISISGGAQGQVETHGCTFLFSNASQSISLGGTNKMVAGQVGGVATPCSIAPSGTVPTTLFNPSVIATSTLIEGADLSGFTSKTLFGVAFNLVTVIVLKDCKLPATVTLSAIAASTANPEIRLINCDSGGNNYRNEQYNGLGTLTTNVSVVRTNGANTGTSYSWKITTQTTPVWASPFWTYPLSVWNLTTGGTSSITIEGIADPRDFSALPKNDDVWFDVEYLGSATSPIGSTTFGTKANNLATGTALTASTQAWDSAATTRANSTAYSLGDIRKVSSNVGRLFLCTTAGTSSGSLPGGYATAVDGDAITDGTAVFKAVWRFNTTVTTGVINLVGPITVWPKVAKPSLNGIYLDPYLSSPSLSVTKSTVVSPGVLNETGGGAAGNSIIGGGVG